MKQLLEREHGIRFIVFALLLTMLAWLAPMNIGVANAATGDAKIPVTGGSLLFDKTTGTITGYEGEITEAAIPETFDGVKVVMIGTCAFEGCESLSSVIIPEGVTTIGNEVFAECSISSLTIPASVTNIGGEAFDRTFSLKEINVDAANPEYSSLDGVLCDKNGTKIIEYPAGRTDRSYVIPEGVTAIGWCAFRSGSLNSVTLPNSLTTIEGNAFSLCFNLSEIKVGEENPNFSTDGQILLNKDGTTLVYYYEKNKESYTIPEGVTTIAKEAFSGSRSLTSLTISKSVRHMNVWTLHGASWLKQINVDEGNPVYSSMEGTLFNKGKTTLIRYPRSKAGSFVIPDTVKTIEEGAFADSFELTEVVMPSSVERIEESAFSGCHGLMEIEIPESVTSIGRDAFGWSIKTIKGYDGSVAYYYAQDEDISFVSLGNAKNPLNRIAYAVDGGNLYFYKSTGTIAKADDTITEALIPEMVEGVKVTSISNRAFSDCSNLTNVTIPNSITSIGERAFSGYVRLDSVTIPDSVINIGEKAFGYYWGGDDFELTKNPDFKIYGYSNDSVAAKYAKDNGFDYAIVRSEGTEPGGDDKPTGGSEGTEPGGDDKPAGDNGDGNKGDDPSDKNDNGQSNNGSNQINLPVTSTKDEPATDPTTAKVGSMVNDKKSNGSYVVTQTKNGGGTVTYKKPVDKKKSSVTIPATVRIEGKTYKVTAVEKNAFKGNKNLKSVKIGSNIEKIGANAFNKCTKLKTVKLSGKVKTIQKGAFANCKNLKNITIQTKKLTKKTVGAGAFKGINSKATVKVPKGKAKAYQKLLRSKGLSKKAKVK